MNKNNQNSIDYLDEVYSDLEFEEYNFAYLFTCDCMEAILEDDSKKLDDVVAKFKDKVKQSLDYVKSKK